MVDPRSLRHCMFNSLLHHPAFPTDSIERSAERVFQVPVMAVPQSAVGRLGPSLTNASSLTCGPVSHLFHGRCDVGARG